MSQIRFKGVYTAIITPMKEDGSVDEAALRNLIDFQIENGVAGIVPVGTTGECPTLNHAEHNHVVEFVTKYVKQKNKSVQVIAGTGSNATSEAVSMTKHAKEAGADASLQVSPYYNKPTQEGLYRHFKKIGDEADLPLVIYNIQGRTGINIETLTLMRLAKDCKNIVSVKEASGNMSQMMDVITESRKLSQQTGRSFDVLSGDDNLTLPLISLGGTGVISVASNIAPKQMVEMVDAALKGDYETAQRIHYELLPLLKIIFIETNPIPVKTALAMMGKCTEAFRLPLCEMKPENKEKLRAVLKELKLI
ncbi:TPA: 4-hydroxy-tetrahydrodipicolinate synthase [Candidatus Woesearchaeota archaeon]|nr:4-hydroxy-tetrahydrodipicolinate synthase [Candidatus Woesearchaeota archaeon]